MSVNLLLEDATDPVIWRGPVIAGTVKQFWQDVVWKDVDYMIIIWIKKKESGTMNYSNKEMLSFKNSSMMILNY